MLVYLIKMIVCSGIFYSLYATLFNKEKMLVFNRFYLLGGLVASFLIPLITITVEAPVAASQQLYMTVVDDVNVQPAQIPDLEPVRYLDNVAIILAVMISSCLLARFMMNFLSLKAAIKRGTGFYLDRVRVVLLNQRTAPHSFLNTIYLSKNEYEEGRIETEVIEHELAHIRQKHSWDILLIELLKIITWFNPFIYLYKRSVKINHELLADAAVIKQLGDVRHYQQVLLQRAVAQNSLVLVSSFTFYVTKKRLLMLAKKYDRKRTALISMALIPTVIVAVLIGCNTEEKKETSLTANEQKELAQLKEEALSTVTKDTTISLAMSERASVKDSGTAAGLTEPEIEIKKFSPSKVIKDLPEGPGASANELATYEDIIKQMLSGGKNKYKWIEGRSGQLLPIYKKMTVEQRKKASQLPPPPPPKVEVKKFAPPKIVNDEETGRQHSSNMTNKTTISGLVDLGPGKGATDQELQEYKKLVDQMRTAIALNDTRTITSMWNEYSKAHWIFSSMDKQQRAKYKEELNELAMLSNKKAAAITRSGQVPDEPVAK